MFRINSWSRIANCDEEAVVWLSSVVIDNSRAPSSTELIASTAFKIKFKTTCCS